VRTRRPARIDVILTHPRASIRLWRFDAITHAGDHPVIPKDLCSGFEVVTVS
jgi:hypothetical protein